MKNRLIERLIRKEYSYITGILVNMGLRGPDLEDVRQEVLIDVYKNIDTLKDENKMKPWLSVITRNRCNQFFRKKRERCYVSFDDEDRELEYIPSGELESGLLKILEDAENSSQISDAIHQLDEKYFAIIVYHFVKNYSLKEIAEKTGINYNTVKSRYKRALLKLKRIIGEGGLAEYDTKGKSKSGEK